MKYDDIKHLKIGPNMMRLVIMKMSCEAIPSGSKDPLASAIEFLSNRESISAATKAASVWAHEAVSLVKTCPDSPYGKDDESIAAAILAKIAMAQKSSSQKLKERSLELLGE